MFGTVQLLKAGAMVSGALAAVILLYWLIRRPPLHTGTKLWLLLGLGPLAIASAMLGNVANLEVSKERQFCGSCHVMIPYTQDAANPASTSLASRHSQNAWFGGESCYVCHADYGMFGAAATKIGGMHHVWDYYSKDWGPGSRKPALYKPYSNATCMRCHPMTGGQKPLAHQVHVKVIEAGQTSCASMGCHGPAHRVGGEEKAHGAQAALPGAGR